MPSHFMQPYVFPLFTVLLLVATAEERCLLSHNLCSKKTRKADSNRGKIHEPVLTDIKGDTGGTSHRHEKASNPATSRKFKVGNNYASMTSSNDSGTTSKSNTTSGIDILRRSSKENQDASGDEFEESKQNPDREELLKSNAKKTPKARLAKSIKSFSFRMRPNNSTKSKTNASLHRCISYNPATKNPHEKHLIKSFVANNSVLSEMKNNKTALLISVSDWQKKTTQPFLSANIWKLNIRKKRSSSIDHFKQSSETTRDLKVTDTTTAFTNFNAEEKLSQTALYLNSNLHQVKLGKIQNDEMIKTFKEKRNERDYEFQNDINNQNVYHPGSSVLYKKSTPISIHLKNYEFPVEVNTPATITKLDSSEKAGKRSFNDEVTHSVSSTPHTAVPTLPLFQNLVINRQARLKLETRKRKDKLFSNTVNVEATAETSTELTGNLFLVASDAYVTNQTSSSSHLKTNRVSKNRLNLKNDHRTGSFNKLSPSHLKTRHQRAYKSIAKSSEAKPIMTKIKRQKEIGLKYRNKYSFNASKTPTRYRNVRKKHFRPKSRKISSKKHLMYPIKENVTSKHSHYLPRRKFKEFRNKLRTYKPVIKNSGNKRDIQSLNAIDDPMKLKKLLMTLKDLLQEAKSKPHENLQYNASENRKKVSSQFSWEKGDISMPNDSKSYQKEWHFYLEPKTDEKSLEEDSMGDISHLIQFKSDQESMSNAAFKDPSAESPRTFTILRCFFAIAGLILVIFVTVMIYATVLGYKTMERPTQNKKEHGWTLVWDILDRPSFQRCEEDQDRMIEGNRELKRYLSRVLRVLHFSSVASLENQYSTQEHLKKISNAMSGITNKM